MTVFTSDNGGELFSDNWPLVGGKTTFRPARERANLAQREPERLAALRGQWEAWNATMPPIPEDATVSLGYSAKDMPQR